MRYDHALAAMLYRLQVFTDIQRVSRTQNVLKFSDVVYRIYETVLSPELQPAVLDSVASLSQSDGAFICTTKSGDWAIVIHSPGLTEAVRIYEAEGWRRYNPWLNHWVEAGFRVGDVYNDHDIIDDDKMAENQFYSVFLPRVGLGWQMAAVIESSLGTPTGLVVQRAKTKGPYGADEMKTLGLISRHIEQALRISTHFDTERTARGCVTSAFDVLDRPAFVVDQDQSPILINQRAHELIGRYFVTSDGRLKPARQQEHLPFTQAVRSAHTLHGENGATPQPTTISGTDGTSRLVVWTLPVVGTSAKQLGVPQHKEPVLVLAHPLEQDRIINPAVIRNVFGLTLGEARLAALLGSGKSVKAAAETLGITEGTARVVLKRVFMKLGVSRQAELVSKLTVFAR